METSDVDLDAYLREFGAAFARRDAETSATLWGLPGMLFADDFAKASQSREDVAAGESPAFPIYGRVGLSRIEQT